MTGTFAITRSANHIGDHRPHRNKALVLDAMTSMFQRHDASAVERLYSDNYIQHNLNIPQGRDALRGLVATLAPSVYYEQGLIIADGDLVAIHGRILGWVDEPQIVVDIFRVQGASRPNIVTCYRTRCRQRQALPVSQCSIPRKKEVHGLSE